MSENYSEERKFIIGEKFINALVDAKYLSEEEALELRERCKEIENPKNIIYQSGLLQDDTDKLFYLINVGLNANIDGRRYNTGITTVMLDNTINTIFGETPSYKERDKNKQNILHDVFPGTFDEMFGEKGRKQLYTGKGDQFTEDFISYYNKMGIDRENALKDLNALDMALQISVSTGVYNKDDFDKLEDIKKKVTEGRKKYELSEWVEKTLIEAEERLHPKERKYKCFYYKKPEEASELEKEPPKKIL